MSPSLWPQQGSDNSKCPGRVVFDAANQASCQARAVSRGHGYYS
eukprot:gene4955-934_t